MVLGGRRRSCGGHAEEYGVGEGDRIGRAVAAYPKGALGARFLLWHVCTYSGARSHGFVCWRNKRLSRVVTVVSISLCRGCGVSVDRRRRAAPAPEPAAIGAFTCAQSMLSNYLAPVP